MSSSEDILLGKTKRMIDELKTVCADYGLANDSSEYKIITETFQYKFLCDRFIYELGKLPAFNGIDKSEDIEQAYANMSDTDWALVQLELESDTAIIGKDYLISKLFNDSGNEGFSSEFDEAFRGVADDNKEIFSVRTGSGARIELFSGVSRFIVDEDRRDRFCAGLISVLAAFSFNDVFGERYDFFSAVFEYLIKDYNKDSGTYGEYFTPHAIASIIAKILVPDEAQDVTVYDPAAGSGTLALAIAHEIGEQNCTIYTQDRSQKANEFMRLNLILNSLVHSLPNVVHDDTLVNPRHMAAGNKDVMKFDYIVSNPPFKCDFSNSHDTLTGAGYSKRFWAGVPNVPKGDPAKMAIYLMFLQHILYSMNEADGKAAVVVPTGFLTAKGKIEVAIRQKMIDDGMLRGVVSMPSNIFANTGTNVSIIFLDKEHFEDKAILIDASKLGTKVKIDKKNQKTVLSDEEVASIIETFNVAKEQDDFSTLVNYDEILKKKLSFSAGQYFDVKVEYVELSPEEFKKRMDGYQDELTRLFSEGNVLRAKILKGFSSMDYRGRN